MGRLDLLRKNLLHMTDDELREHIRRIRSERKIRKDKPQANSEKKPRKTRTATPKESKKAEDLLAGMSPEALAKLLEKMS